MSVLQGAPLAILYHDEHLVAVDKPPGMVVHRTRIATDAEAVLQRLRDQIGQRVYPVHRLDRPTSGVLLFALSAEGARRLGERFENHQVDKRYWAVVRGHSAMEEVIDYPLQEAEDRPAQSAITAYRRLATVELEIPVGRYPQARYSLLELQPKTGRMHQIRKHLHHICRPIAGDTTYGEGRHNRLFRQHLQLHRLMLFARELRLTHPFDGTEVSIRAPLDARTRQVFQGWAWPLD